MEIKIDKQIQQALAQFEQESVLHKRIISNLLTQNEHLKSSVRTITEEKRNLEIALSDLDLLADWLVIFFKSEGFSSADMFQFLNVSKSEDELKDEIEMVETILKDRFSQQEE